MSLFYEPSTRTRFSFESAVRAVEISNIPIINAGDGAGQHPTQALLDIYTIVDAFPEMRNHKVALVGDLHYGRTVRSLSYLLSKYENMEIIFVSPSVCRMENDIKTYLNK